MQLPHLAARIFGAPILIAPEKLDIILSAVGKRFVSADLLPANKPFENRKYESSGNIGVIPILGTLLRRTNGLQAQSGLSSYSDIQQMLQNAVADNSVKGILLDIDSPGGEAGGVFDLADQIFAARKIKPVWAVANDQAFSAAYALAAAAERIYVTRTSGVGSIGVIAVHLDQSQADKDAGLKYTAIYAGARKNDLSPHNELTDPARNALQAEVDRVYALFVNSVATYRKLNPEQVSQTEAALFFGEEGLSLGLATHAGTYADALIDFQKTLTKPAAPKGRLFSTRKEKRMNDNQPTPEAAAGEEQIKAEAKAEALSYVAEINELCMLAKMPDKAADFVRQQVKPAAVRQALLNAQAERDEATAIASQLPSNELAKAAPTIDTAAIYAARNKKE